MWFLLYSAPIFWLILKRKTRCNRKYLLPEKNYSRSNNYPGKKNSRSNNFLGKNESTTEIITPLYFCRICFLKEGSVFFPVNYYSGSVFFSVNYYSFKAVPLHIRIIISISHSNKDFLNCFDVRTSTKNNQRWRRQGATRILN